MTPDLATVKAQAKSSALDSVLKNYVFVNESAQAAGRALLDTATQVDDAGQVTANGITLQDFARHAFYNEHAYMLAPIPAGGAGSVAGMSPAYYLATPKADLNDIKPGMSAGQRANIIAAIRDALGR